MVSLSTPLPSADPGEAPVPGSEQASLRLGQEVTAITGHDVISSEARAGAAYAWVVGALDSPREESSPADPRVVVVAALGVEDGAASAGQHADEPHCHQLLHDPQ